MNQSQSKSSPSVNRSVTFVDPPPLAEYFAQHEAPKRQANEFTLQEFCDATGLSDPSARRALKKDLDTGKLTQRHCVLDRKRVLLYCVKP